MWLDDPDGRPVEAPHLSVTLPDCGDATTTTTSTTLAPCGNGIVDDVEQCDDGNTTSGDGCEDDCSSDIVCGDASGDDSVQTGDALLVLRAADSLRVLKRAVGQSVVMSCPAPS